MSDENENTATENTEAETNDEATADDWGAALDEQADAEGKSADDYESAEIQTLLEDEVTSPDDVNLDVIMEIPVTLSMEIGRTEISIRNLLQLNQGSVVELDRLAGEPMDVMVNGTLVAHGEVVVVNEKFGIRLTDIISPQERVKKLR